MFNLFPVNFPDNTSGDSSISGTFSTLSSLKTRGLMLVLLAANLLSGCGVAHVKSNGQGDGWRNYNKVVIGEVKVYSREPAANNNPALQTKMQNWQQDARRQLETYTKTVQSRLPAKAQGAAEKVLVVNLDTEVTYGNRAMRYFVGFGAGKGGVRSMLSMADSTTKAEIFLATSDSDLSVGAFGGDIGKAFTGNLEKLLQQYPDGANLTQAAK